VRSSPSEKKFAILVPLAVVSVTVVLAASVVRLTASSLEARVMNFYRVQSEYVARAGVAEALTRLANGEIHDPDEGNPDWRAEICVGLRTESSPPIYRYTSYQTDLSYGTLKDPVTVTYLLDRGSIVYFDPDSKMKTTRPGDYPVYVAQAVGGKGRSASRFRGEYISYPFQPRMEEAFICESWPKPLSRNRICSNEHGTHLPALTRPPFCARYHVSRKDDLPVPSGRIPSTSEVLGISPAELITVLRAASVNRSLENEPVGITFFSTHARYDRSVSGSGLLYVVGNLVVKGDFRFNGLVYVEGSASFAGDVWVVGGLVVSGHCNVGPTVLYSREAIVESMRNSILVDLSRI